jgi:hypothetical protein
MLPDDLYKDTVDPDYNIQRIINQEKERILLKETKVNLEYDTKKRQETLTQNQTARRKAYTHMLLVGSVTVILSVLFFYLVRSFPDVIPEIVTDLMMTTIIVIGVIYVIILYIDLQRRDVRDYNKTDFGHLLKTPSDPINGETNDVTKLKQSTRLACKGSECCPNNYSSGSNTCFAEGFSPLPEYSLLH